MSSAMLKYDQTGEALQATATGHGGTETGCSVLTPEQIYSQLSMVLHSGEPAVNTTESSSESSDKHGSKREKGSSLTLGEAPVPRKLTEAKTGIKRARKGRKSEQPKRAKEAKVARTLAEKRPQRHRLRMRKESKPPLVDSSQLEPDTKPTCSSLSLPGSTHYRHVHVVEVSPDVPEEVVTLTNTPNSLPGETSAPTKAEDELPPPPAALPHLSVNGDETDTSDSTVRHVSTTSTSSTVATHEPATSTAMVAKLPCCHGSPCRPPNYELLGRLIGETILTSFYHSFHSSHQTEHLKIELLDPLGGEGCDTQHRENGILPRWLQITQKRMHIDPHLGPILLARILISNAGIVKFQHLFPFTKTVFMRHMKSAELKTVLSELSPRHVLCQGLPQYPKYHIALGYHPEDIRIRHVQTPDYQRYDHRRCPILHVPRKIPSQNDDNSMESMCTKCAQLNTFILKVICDKFSCPNPLPCSETAVNPSHATDATDHPPTSEHTHKLSPLSTYVS